MTEPPDASPPTDPRDLAARLREARRRAAAHAAATPPAPGARPIPAALAAIPDGRRVHLDARDRIRRGDEPFGAIMQAVKALAPDQALILRAPFEPLPLYGVLARRGLAHWTECRAPDDWVVAFYRDEDAAAPAAPPAEPAGPARAVQLDVRGLEPPEPMVQVLTRIEALAPGQTLEVLHDRRPLFLYPQLDERGFLHETDEPAPGVVRIRIRRG
jgi:uncharacterized protein (DUF2249 family)